MKIQQITQNLSEKHLAQRWCVSVRTIQRLRQSNILSYINCGKRGIRYPLSGIEAYEANTLLNVPTANHTWGLKWKK